MNLRQIYNDHMGSSYDVLDSLDVSRTEAVFLDLFNGRLLDVGCGNGRLGIILLDREQVESVTFLDVADVCVEYVRKGIHRFGIESSNWQINRSTIEDFTDDIFYNVAAFFEGLEHVVDVGVVVNKIESLLTKGGIFIGSVPVGVVCDHHTHLHHFYEGDIQAVLSPVFSQVTIEEIVVSDKSHYVFKAVR